MKTLTPQQIVDLKPCEGYNLKYVTKLFNNKKSMTYLEILDIDKIPSWDIIWLFCQPSVLSVGIRNQWLEVITTRAVTNCALHCGVNDVEQWAKNWLSGVDRTIRAACAAAGYAVRNYAATYAACAVARAAAVYDSAARYATAAAAAAADADAHAAYTACKTERKQQIEDLKNILQRESK